MKRNASSSGACDLGTPQWEVALAFEATWPPSLTRLISKQYLDLTGERVLRKGGEGDLERVAFPSP